MQSITQSMHRFSISGLALAVAAALGTPAGGHAAGVTEALTGGRKGQHSIRINVQWRICFVWRRGEAWNVEIVDYH